MQISTGYKSLDNVVDFFQTSQLILIASRPQVGKTTLLMNIAASVSMSNKVLFVFLESELRWLEKLFGPSKFIINDNINLSIDELKKLVVQNDYKLVLIDYIQLFTDYRNAIPVLKALAIELDICIVMSAHLSRELEYRPITERMPVIQDLKNTLSSEVDLNSIDKIIFLYRDDYYGINPRNRAENILDVNIYDKVEGSYRGVELYFNKEYSQLSE